MNGFKNFLLRGNLVDLAVAVIIGTAFGAVVTDVHRLADRRSCPSRRRSTSRTTSRTPSVLPERRDLVRDPGRGRLLLRRAAVHEGQGAVLPEPGAGHARGHRAAAEIRDLLAAAEHRHAGSADDLTGCQPAVVGRHLGAQPVVAGVRVAAGPGSASRSSLVVSGSTSPKTAAEPARALPAVSARPRLARRRRSRAEAERPRPRRPRPRRPSRSGARRAARAARVTRSRRRRCRSPAASAALIASLGRGLGRAARRRRSCCHSSSASGSHTTRPRYSGRWSYSQGTVTNWILSRPMSLN